MFQNAAAFNQPLGSTFDVSKVARMEYMFSGAALFNQPLTNFATALCTNMNWMFFNANAFSQNISSWAVSQVTACTNFCASCTPPSFTGC